MEYNDYLQIIKINYDFENKDGCGHYATTNSNYYDENGWIRPDWVSEPVYKTIRFPIYQYSDNPDYIEPPSSDNIFQAEQQIEHMEESIVNSLRSTFWKYFI